LPSDSSSYDAYVIKDGGVYDYNTGKEVDRLVPVEKKSTLTQAAFRKQHPVTSGVLDYFPDAIKEIAHVSWVGNEQHNPGEPLHWAKGKSGDHADALVRHLLDRGTLDSDGCRHSAKVAWRALALLQEEIEAENKKGTP
jgi:hypothetical protein